jgi:uncharacterized membrane protein
VKHVFSTIAGWSDLALERATGMILRVGVITAACLVAAGGVVYLVRSGSHAPEYGTFSISLSAYRSPFAIVRGVFDGHPTALIEAGLLILVLTPVSRVVFALFAFAVRRDVMFVVFSLVVLTILGIGLTGHSL